MEPICQFFGVSFVMCCFYLMKTMKMVKLSKCYIILATGRSIVYNLLVIPIKFIHIVSAKIAKVCHIRHCGENRNNLLF